MTVINPSSISGITSITMPSGDGNVLTIHTNDGVERFRIDSSGNVKIGSACTISQDGDVFFTGVCTATTLTGAASGLTGALPAIDGSALTGMASTENVRTGILDVAGISTFRNTMNVGAAVTISESGIEASGIGITCANINGTQIGGRKNLIINGAMTVSQRGTSFDSTHGIYLLDRFMLEKENNAANFTITQSTTSPDGFSKSLKVDCTTADTSTASNEFVTLRYKIEAQDLQHLSFGTSAAKPLVLSFYVRSNVTGTYAVNCLQRDNSSKLYTRNYTIDSADTWERKTISIPADTSGVINDDTGSGLEIYIPLVMGSTYTSGSQSTTAWETFANSKFAAGHAVNVLSNTSNEWYLTGVQLEVGSQATAFEHRSFGEELALCQRYYFRANQGSDSGERPIALGTYETSSAVTTTIRFPDMRTSPSIDVTDSSNAFMIRRESASDSFDTFTLRYSRVNSAEIVASSGVSGTAGISGMVRSSGASTHLSFSAEL